MEANRRLSGWISLMGFILCILVWRWQLGQVFPLGITLAILLGGVALVYLLAWIGRGWLDAQPTESHAMWVNTWMHFGFILALGCANFQAVKTIPGWKVWPIPFPELPALILVILTSAATTLAVVNLALKGLGAPFAVALSRRVAIDWFYAWTRNPMVLSVIATLLAFGLYVHSSIFLLWTLVLAGPAWCFMLKMYEERELEIRFGAAYLEYKRRTPFLWPRNPHRSDPPPKEHKLPT